MLFIITSETESMVAEGIRAELSFLGRHSLCYICCVFLNVMENQNGTEWLRPVKQEYETLLKAQRGSTHRDLSDVQFPYTPYSFQQFDHCFTVLVDFEGTPYIIDAARELCVKPLG